VRETMALAMDARKKFAPLNIGTILRVVGKVTPKVTPKGLASTKGAEGKPSPLRKLGMK